MPNDNKQGLINVIFWGCIFFTFSYYTFAKLGSGIMPSDFPQHTQAAQQLIDNGLLSFLKTDSYPLWQILVALSSILLRMPLITSATFICSLLNTVTYILLYHFFIQHGLKINFLPSLLCALLIMGPMYIPWFNPTIYLGQGTPNIWHNPTTICVRPFALATFILINNILKKDTKSQNNNTRDIIALAILLIFCNLAKPSFSQGIIPGLGLYIIIKLIYHKGKNLFYYLKIVAAFIPSVLLLVIQWFVSFYDNPSIAGENNGIAISLFEILKLYSPNVLISFILGMAFPIYISLCNWNRIIKKSDLQLLGCCMVASYLENALLVETGVRKVHGNFGWAWLLFMFLAYVFAMREFLIWNESYDYKKTISKIAISIGWGLFFIQAAIGIYYTFHLFS